MEPLAHGAIRFRHLGDLREYSTLPFRLLQLLDALLHRGSFLVRESLGRLAGRGGALGGLLRGLLCAHRSLLCRLSHILLRLARSLLAAPYSHFSIPDRSGTCFATHDDALSRQARASGTGSMQDRGYGLPRTHLPGHWVNKALRAYHDASRVPATWATSYQEVVAG